eukprot:scaffold11077_cov78-Cyclotella_meneghiniana.AAC.6
MGKDGDVNHLSGMRVEVEALAIYFSRGSGGMAIDFSSDRLEAVASDVARGSGHLFAQRRECDYGQDTFKAGAIGVVAMEVMFEARSRQSR